VTSSDRFKEVKTHLGSLDDLGQERRRIYTDWATQRIEPAAFLDKMSENLRRTREAAAALEALLRVSPPPS
jgi:hypothetical protein